MTQNNIDTQKLQSYLQQHAKILSDNTSGNLTLQSVSKFKQGQSNPTYLLDVKFDGSSSKKFVLRKKPVGKLLPGAHMV